MATDLNYTVLRNIKILYIGTLSGLAVSLAVSGSNRFLVYASGFFRMLGERILADINSETKIAVN